MQVSDPMPKNAYLTQLLAPLWAVHANQVVVITLLALADFQERGDISSDLVHQWTDNSPWPYHYAYISVQKGKASTDQHKHVTCMIHELILKLQNDTLTNWRIWVPAGQSCRISNQAVRGPTSDRI